MFSKLTPASLCVCDTSSSKAMIDTQLKRDAEIILTGAIGAVPKAATTTTTTTTTTTRTTTTTTTTMRQPYSAHRAPQTHASEAEVACVNDMNARNRRTQPLDPQDINCNMTEKEKQQQQQQQQSPHQQERPQRQPQQVNRVMSIPNCNGKRTPKTLDVRKEEVMAIRNRFPTKVPIIVQRFCKETALPQLDKSKYLVPQEITMSQFLTIIRNRMRISSTQTLYLLVNNRSMVSLSLTLAEVYNEYAGTDGFLYVTYASQEVFGAAATSPRASDCARARGAGAGPHSRMSADKSHCDAFLDNTYKSMCFG